ncbi:MAG: phosphoribosyltransferase [Candidatus Woesearchaeota archaeon]|nr:phosphoribosyltransferase [Candidatus Woesearchaeota archaeon]
MDLQLDEVAALEEEFQNLSAFISSSPYRYEAHKLRNTISNTLNLFRSIAQGTYSWDEVEEVAFKLQYDFEKEADLYEQVMERERNIVPVNFHRVRGAIGFMFSDDRVAFKGYSAARDKEGLQRVAERFEPISPYLVLRAYQGIGDEAGVARMMQRNITLSPTSIDLVAEYPLSSRLSDACNRFAESYSCSRRLQFAMNSDVLSGVARCVEEYDAALALTTQPLVTGYACRSLGMEVVVSRVKRQGKGATFQWLEDPRVLQGKRVVVLEDDVCSGKTLRRVARELDNVGVVEKAVHFLLGARGCEGNIPREYTVVPNDTHPQLYDTIMSLREHHRNEFIFEPNHKAS